MMTLPAGPPAIDAVGMTKRFGPLTALDDVSLSLPPGSFHAILGENGAGKSTLMRILLGIEHADAGTLSLGGKSFAPRGPADARRAGVVMVPQERTLCPHLDVVENIVLGMEPAGSVGVLRQDEALAIARECRTLLGANGITLDYPVLRHANNLESVLTYEGTSEVHQLVVGQALMSGRSAGTRGATAGERTPLTSR